MQITLDLVFCGRCGAKVYRCRDGNKVWGRCRNELRRSEALAPCFLPRIPYDVLRDLVIKDIQAHWGYLIVARVTDATRRLRAEEIERDLMELAVELAARRIERGEFLNRQTELLDERDALETAEGQPQWNPTGETVGQRWEHLGDPERRLWLLRIGNHVHGRSGDARGREGYSLDLQIVIASAGL